MARITYANECTVLEDDLDQSLLQISLAHEIAHIHACGGNARCSTCRVMVLDHAENVLPRNQAEQDLARKRGFEPNIRLACQMRLCGDVTLRRLVLDDADADLILAQTGVTTGREAKVAVLFTDLRNFTPLTEKTLPYDVVHVLNRYFMTCGEAVVNHGGHIDKYIGDAVMALFGIHGEPAEVACGKAVRAALEMIDGMARMNDWMVRSFGHETGVRMGIGIHYGDVILGEFGHPQKVQFTAIGDVVNIASRLESTTKYAGVEMIISEEVMEHVGDIVTAKGPFQAGLKGKSGSANLYEVTGFKPDYVPPTATPEGAARQAMKSAISRSVAPCMLRLAFHDAASYDVTTGTGGCNGSIRFPDELNRPANRGLEPAIALIEKIKQQVPSISIADLIQLSGAMALDQLRGPHVGIPFGRPDAVAPCPQGRMPYREMTAEQLKDRFSAMGFTVREMVALSGAHNVGRVDGKPYAEDLFTFSNTYYCMLLSGHGTGHFLPTDLVLAEDAECRQFVELYARDQDLFFLDFAEAYTKMSLLGTGLEG